MDNCEKYSILFTIFARIVIIRLNLAFWDIFMIFG